MENAPVCLSCQDNSTLFATFAGNRDFVHYFTLRQRRSPPTLFGVILMSGNPLAFDFNQSGKVIFS